MAGEAAVAAAHAVRPAGTISTSARLDDRLFITCGLAWCAGLIHAQAAFQHIDEYALYALFFALLAPAQFGWGIALYRWPGRTLLRLGAIGSLLVVALWIVSRTSGLPIGPTPWHAESVGATDLIATADEVVLVLLALTQLKQFSGRTISRVPRALLAAAGLLLILSSSLAVIAPAHGH